MVDMFRHRVSKLLRPQKLVPLRKNGGKISMTGHADKNDEGHLSLSHRLLRDAGFFEAESNGYYRALPLGHRVLKKCESLIDKILKDHDCQRMSWPTLTPLDFWEKSGRRSSLEPELMTLKTRRSKEYVLAPTHEESAAQFFSSLGFSYRNLPLSIYQITNKYRDELNPKFGLLRSREFLMKDMYTFDVDYSAGMETYERVSSAYQNIFSQLEVPYLRVLGSGTSMASSSSHEYHYLTQSVGQDRLGRCSRCGVSFNQEIINNRVCLECQSPSVEPIDGSGIEVAHTFHLGTTYSNIFKAHYVSNQGQSCPAYMCCFGIGISRVVAASAEVLSESKFLRWPKVISPFKVCLIQPKNGSREYEEAVSKIHRMYDDDLRFIEDDVLIDDQDECTIGLKIRNAKKIGIPIIVVYGKDSVKKDSNSKVEIHTYENEVIYTHESNVNSFVREYFLKKKSSI